MPVYNPSDFNPELVDLSLQKTSENHIVADFELINQNGKTITQENYEVVGADNSAAFINHLIANNPKGRFLEVEAFTLKINEKFDGIFSNKVMHHPKDNELLDSIKRQHKILNNDGIICHSFWKGEGSEVFKGLFVNYHLEHALREFFEEYFKILMIKDYAEFEEADSLLLIGKKNTMQNKVKLH